MRKYKMILPIILLITLLCGQTLTVFGAEQEWYSLTEVEDNLESDTIVLDEEEITPYSRYILGASVLLRNPSSGVLQMRSEVYCTETMSKITTTFTLQKKSGSSWINVGKGTVSVSNDNSMYKSMKATGASSGTYRCVANTQVVSKSGYAETISVTSSSLEI